MNGFQQYFYDEDKNVWNGNNWQTDLNTQIKLLYFMILETPSKIFNYLNVISEPHTQSIKLNQFSNINKFCAKLNLKTNILFSCSINEGCWY